MSCTIEKLAHFLGPGRTMTSGWRGSSKVAIPIPSRNFHCSVPAPTTRASLSTPGCRPSTWCLDWTITSTRASVRIHHTTLATTPSTSSTKSSIQAKILLLSFHFRVAWVNNPLGWLRLHQISIPGEKNDCFAW